jgi:DDE superfamily endonuclease
MISTDEKTGMQALDRAHPTRPRPPGGVERVEVAYIRHGTQAVIAHVEVATGHVLAPSVGPTRTAEDCVAHMERTIALAPEAAGVLVVDRLTTPQSASVVRLVAQPCGIEAARGVKGTSGLSASMEQRASF